MGATTFECYAKGKTAKDAFQNARKEARLDHGRLGYTGTIAEKDTFEEVNVIDEVRNNPALLSAKIEELTDTNFDDKFGPAGCIKIKEGEYVFFGWAAE